VGHQRPRGKVDDLQLLLGHQGPRGGVQRIKNLKLGPPGPKVDLAVLPLVLRRSSYIVHIWLSYRQSKFSTAILAEIAKKIISVVVSIFYAYGLNLSQIGS